MSPPKGKKVASQGEKQEDLFHVDFENQNIVTVISGQLSLLSGASTKQLKQQQRSWALPASSKTWLHGNHRCTISWGFVPPNSWFLQAATFYSLVPGNQALWLFQGNDPAKDTRTWPREHLVLVSHHFKEVCGISAWATANIRRSPKADDMVDDWRCLGFNIFRCFSWYARLCYHFKEYKLLKILGKHLKLLGNKLTVHLNTEAFFFC